MVIKNFLNKAILPAFAVVLAAFIPTAGMPTAATAADLGGDCCTDLEERVAELEATTARKGNRKVSLTISGWVAQQLMYYDNGPADDLYVTGIGSTVSSHFKLSGAAKIDHEWSAGYVIHIEANTSDPLTAGNTEFRDNGPSGLRIVQTGGDEQAGSLDLLYSFMFVKNDKLGKVSLGLIPQASQHNAVFTDGSGSLLQANWVPLDGMGINISRNGNQQLQLPGAGFPLGALMWCGTTGLPLSGDCNAVPLNGVRYDAPTIAGFTFSASWGEDDFWDVALRYAGKFGDFKVASSIAYSHHSDDEVPGFNTVVGLGGFNPTAVDASYLQVSGFVQHAPSGVFLFGSYGEEDNNNTYANAVVTANQPSGNVWYAKLGIRQKWSTLGHTTLYGEYGEREDMFHPALSAFNVTGSNVTQWGAGVVQDIDAAAMALWVKYKNYDPTMEGPGVAGNFDNLDDISLVLAGGLISF